MNDDELLDLPVDGSGLRLRPDAAPDPDESLPDPFYQLESCAETLTVVRAHFRQRRGCLVAGRGPIYYGELTDFEKYVIPDLLVAFRVNPIAIRERNGYFLRDVGKAPDFVLEIGSASTWEDDLGPKRDLYTRMGIQEYWRFDGTGGKYYGEPLVGETLVDGQYRQFDIHQESVGLVWGHSPALGLDLCWEPKRLRFFNPATGLYLLNLKEEHAARKAAEKRIAVDRERTAAAEAEAADLREQIRRLQG